MNNCKKCMNQNSTSELPVCGAVTATRKAVAKVPSARLGTLDELIASVFPNFIVPVPSKETLRAWLDRENTPRFKANPMAIRGGGPVFYSISHVEDFLRKRTLPGRLRRLR